MDVSLYNFECQKMLHQALQIAKSLAHKYIEVEHVALAVLKSNLLDFSPSVRRSCSEMVYQNLTQMPRHFGQLKISFGKRLNLALNEVEAKRKSETIGLEEMWDVLVKQSSVLRLAMAKFQSDEENFEPMFEAKYDKTSAKKKADQVEKKTSPRSKVDESLRRYTIDLSELAERGELDPVIGRDSELRRVLEILGRKKKNNPILLGEPGVGKSAIAEALAIKIAENKVPESMRSKRVLSLDLASLIAGARYRGEFEERIKALLSALKELDGEVILFIDEIHMIVGAGSSEGTADAANIMKPALARGEIHALGATTHAEYKKYIETDTALERRFQPLIVEEPNKETSLSILRGLKSRYEIHHGVRISDDALQSAVTLSVRYIAQRRLPDKAIDLVDEAASRLRLQVESMPSVLDELGSRIMQLEIEKNSLGRSTKTQKSLQKIESALLEVRREHDAINKIWREHQEALRLLKATEKEREETQGLLSKVLQQGDFAFASKLQLDALPKAEQRLSELRQCLDQMQRKHNFLAREVGAREIAEVVSNWTGVPMGRLLEDESRKLSSLDKRLKNRIFGQKSAVDKVSRALKRSRLGLNDPNRPIATMIFLGPTGVGKTELAKATALEFFGDSSKMIRIDMSEFMEAHNVARLIGAPPGYIGFSEGGELTEQIKQRPYCVLLFDEIEKAHPRVLDTLLQILDEGRLSDSRGRLVNFKNTLIILTSNLQIYSRNANGTSLSSDQEVRSQLSAELRPELVNRLDEIVVFEKLGSKHFESMLKKFLGELNDRLMERELRVEIGPRLEASLIRAGSESSFGGRALKRAFDSIVVEALTQRLLIPGLSMQGVWAIEQSAFGALEWSEGSNLMKLLPPGKAL